jgi:hypothetical protein
LHSTYKGLLGGNDPFKLAFIPLDEPSSVLSVDVLHVLVGLEMVDCHAMRSAVGSAIVNYFYSVAH